MEPIWMPVKGDIQAAVSAVHTFGTDALLLSDFAAPRRGERVCDLGTGCGAVALRLCATGLPAAVHGVDIAPEAIALAAQSAARFPGTPRPTFAVADWCHPAGVGAAGSFHRVVCNPPYFPPGSGGLPPDGARRIARHEQPGTLSAVCRAAAWLLQNGGRFCLCHRPERLPDVLAALAAAGLTPKRMRPVCRTADAPPWLLLLEARKGGNPGLVWEPPLVTHPAEPQPPLL